MSFREHDRLLPIANVARIMKASVPPVAKISKEAKESVQECVSEFIAFVTGEAAEKCANEKRKTITGDDIVWAMEQLGFDHYAQLMRIYLGRYKVVMRTSESGGILGDEMTGSPIPGSGTIPMNVGNISYIPAPMMIPAAAPGVPYMLAPPPSQAAQMAFFEHVMPQQSPQVNNGVDPSSVFYQTPATTNSSVQQQAPPQ